MEVSRGALVREFFVEARGWCVLVRLSRVACVGWKRVVAAVWPAGSSLSRDITGALRVSRILTRHARYTDTLYTCHCVSGCVSGVYLLSTQKHVYLCVDLHPYPCVSGI